jgi:hypothetical protein
MEMDAIGSVDPLTSKGSRGSGSLFSRLPPFRVWRVGNSANPSSSAGAPRTKDSAMPLCAPISSQDRASSVGCLSAAQQANRPTWHRDSLVTGAQQLRLLLYRRPLRWLVRRPVQGTEHGGEKTGEARLVSDRDLRRAAEQVSYSRPPGYCPLPVRMSATGGVWIFLWGQSGRGSRTSYLLSLTLITTDAANVPLPPSPSISSVRQATTE